MPTSRIKTLDIDHREIFTAVYGVNSTSEVFITKDMRIHNLREILYLYLKSLGYITIFVDDKVFSYEQQPLIDFFGFTVNRQPQAAPQTGIRDFFKGKGPMAATRNMAVVSQNAEPNADTSQSLHDSIRVETSSNQQRFIVFQEEGILNNVFAFARKYPQRKLAVIFVTPDTFHLSEQQTKTYLNSFSDLRSDFKRNQLALRLICLFQYTSSDIFVRKLENEGDAFFFDSPFKENILNDIGGSEKENFGAEWARGKTVFFLPPPERDEIANMLNYRRLLTANGLPHLFTRVKWDLIELRIWQGIQIKQKNNKSKTLSLISDLLEYDQLDAEIEKMDTVKAVDRLNAMLGIDNIRTQFANYRAALAAHRAGYGGGRFRPHMALMGSPGTGKSTVARLFGEILREDGLLPKGHFLKVSVDELIGEHIGSTRPKTRAVCERARGGVLFIDEAYGLMSGKNSHGNVNYGEEAIEVLIQFMEDNDDSLVILAGYTDEINNLINEGNKGFRRRFNDLGFFDFKDYSPEVLYRISIGMINVPMTDGFRKALKGIIRYKWAYKNKKFGNVGDMENMVNLIVNRYRSLNTTEPLDVKHLPDDLKLLVDPSALNTDVLFADLNNILGQEEVKSIIRSLFVTVSADRTKLRNHDDYIPRMPKLNFLFTGSPGTGKTTIARIVGNILRKLGVFPNGTDDILTEKSGRNLVGASSSDIKKLFEDNIGRVLFIDEAYELARDTGVLADIVANVELPEFKNKLSVIMAGYPEHMSQLMSLNPGLTSRFINIPFTDYTNEQLYEILCRMVSSARSTVMDADVCRRAGMRYFSSLARGANFGNAREAENLLQKLCQNRDSRFVDSPAELQAILDYGARIVPQDFPGYTPDIEQETETGDTPQAPVFDGVLDLTNEDADFMVSSGNHIYSSVGLLETPRGVGTGFIVSLHNRLIITASHVVEDERQFKLILNMPTGIHQSEAHLLWNNPQSDMALLQVDSLPAGARYFGFDITTPRDPGVEISIAAFPMGRDVSNKVLLTSGRISNFEPNCGVHNEHGVTRRFDAIHTDAAATHGSSGGPVLLSEGMRVVGVLHGGINEGGFAMNVVSDISQLFRDLDVRNRQE